MSGTSDAGNPLASPQRERSGATTFGKYEYQYHWALCKILKLHQQSSDYVVFVEYHEDVIVGNNLDGAAVRFEFNQIKNFAGGRWKLNRILKRKKVEGSSDKSSVLGKMIAGAKGKGFYDRLDSLALVNTSGFDIDLKNNDLKLSVITVGDLTPGSLKEISDALKEEVGDADVPPVLKFVLSDLTVASFQEASIGRIAELIESKWPNCGYRAKSIYLSLLDDLHRKGMVTFDFSQWNACVNEKGLTSVKFQEVIDLYLQQPTVEDDLMKFREALSTLSADPVSKVQLVMAFKRYYQERNFGRSLHNLDIHKEVEFSVDRVLGSPSIVAVGEGLDSFLAAVLGEISDEAKSKFSDDLSLKAAIIYEFSKKA